MSPDEERSLLDSTSAEIEDAARAAFDRMVQLILGGADPRAAAMDVVVEFQADFGDALAAALSVILGQSIGTAAVLELQVGAVRLSSRLYAEAQVVSTDVANIVQRHVRGFVDARRLALELFEGYTFRAPDAEPLQFNPRNDKLPKYLREALADTGVADSMARAFAQLQVSGLSTPALQAAYADVLRAIDAIEAGPKAQARLNKRLEVAWYERMRFFATRIARTELHRAYMDREAQLLMLDTDVEYLQVRRAPGRQEPCICALFTGRDQYGLGPGVYPKAVAPRPGFHPFCMCVLAPRLDLTGRKAKERDDAADVSFLARAGETVAARIMGSQARRDQVLRGASAEEVVNAGRDPAYRVRTVAG